MIVWAMYDSGCGESSGPSFLGSNLEIRPSRMSLAGAVFSTANDESVGAQGRRVMPGWVEGMGDVQVGFEVSNINKLLLSSHQVAKLGLNGWLEEGRGALYNRQGEKKIRLYVHNDGYWIKIFVRCRDVVVDQPAAAAVVNGDGDLRGPGGGGGETKEAAESINEKQKDAVSKTQATPASEFEFRNFPRLPAQRG